MSPLKVSDPGGNERFSKTKVTGLITSLLATWRLAETLFHFHVLPDNVEEKIGPVIDIAYMVGGVLVIWFRGKKG